MGLEFEPGVVGSDRDRDIRAGSYGGRCLTSRVIRVTLDPVRPSSSVPASTSTKPKASTTPSSRSTLMERAIVRRRHRRRPRAAPSVDSIRVVSLFSWRYGNPAWLLAERLGLAPNELAYTSAGGNTPQTLVNRTALDLAAGRLDTAMLSAARRGARACALARSARSRWP